MQAILNEDKRAIQRLVTERNSKKARLEEKIASILDPFFWYDKNSGGTTHPVGQKMANPYGLHDIYGNVSEWVQDEYAQEWPTDREITDYQGPSRGSGRVIRGGTFGSTAEVCRSAGRRNDSANSTSGGLGFRLVLSPE
jgi:formylglycine-generating enzyme required for sulfatase activity